MSEDSLTVASNRRRDFLEAIRDASDRARDLNWDWIDQFCHPTVASIPFVEGRSPNAGADWPSTAAGQAAALRLGVSYALVELIRVAHALNAIVTVLEREFIRDGNVVPPADR